MARISTYQSDSNVTSLDKWIGTDGNDYNRTKNFSPNGIADFFNKNESIDSNSVRFTYDTILSGASRKPGTLSFKTEIGPLVQFSSVTTFMLSKNSKGSDNVSEFLKLLNKGNVLLYKSGNINQFGFFKVNNILEDVVETNFYNVTVSFLSGNGNLEEDGDYSISLIDSATLTVNLQQVVDVGNTIVLPTNIQKGIDITLANRETVYQNGIAINVPLQTGYPYPTYNASPDAIIVNINGQDPEYAPGFVGGVVVNASNAENVAFLANLNSSSQYSSGLMIKSYDAHAGNYFQATKSIAGVSNGVFYVANNGSTHATSFVKIGGTSSQFLKADGSVDSNTYVTTASAITNTSQLINDGDNGVSHFISLEDLPSNLILYPTNVSSDVATYYKLVSSIDDTDYNTTAVNIPTGTIVSTNQFISALVTKPNIIIGSPGQLNITIIGNIQKLSGTGDAEFYFKIYKRTESGVETLITTSGNTLPVVNSGYSEFSANALWNDGIFASTDRIVIKFYANHIHGGSNPSFRFQFGGSSPVRMLVPISLNVSPVAVPYTGATGPVDLGPYNLTVNRVTVGRYGLHNTILGEEALVNYLNLNAIDNTAIGYRSLFLNEDGSGNNAFGAGNLYTNISGSLNVSLGNANLYGNVNGSRNIAIGSNIWNSSDFSNTITIGTPEYGIIETIGDNTTLIGNESTLTAIIYGNLVLGSTYDDGVNKLQVSGDSMFTGYLTSYSGFINNNGDVNSFLKADGTLDNNSYLIKSGDTITGNIGNTSTGYFRLPNGTTAQRPSSPVSGMHRYNTNTLRDEFYANASWQNHARLSGDTFTGNIFATNLSGTNTGDETSSTIISKLGYTPADNSNVVHITGTETITGIKSFQGTTATDGGQLGSELTTTGTGDSSWTGTSFATGYTHTTGSVVDLTSSLSAINATYYQILYTIIGRTAGSITIGYGGISTGAVTVTGNTSTISISTAALTVTPTTDFNGTLVLSIKIVGTSSATTVFLNSSGSISNEIRASGTPSNFIQGLFAGSRNTIGANNYFSGYSAGRNNITGNGNAFAGIGTGQDNTTGGSNTGFGNAVLGNGTSIFGNSAFGYGALQSATTGIYNVAIGYLSLSASTTSSNNIAIGRNTLLGLTVGSSNTVIGDTAAQFIANKSTAVTSSANSIFLGWRTSPLADSQTNQVVIGYDSIGLGSNTTVLGNSSTVTTAIYGNLLLGGTTSHNAKLDVTGASLQNGNLFFAQPIPTAKTVTATLTIAELLTGIITVTSVIAVTLTLPTGTLTDAGILSGLLPINNAFEWTVINLGSSVGIVTLSAGTAHTIVGLTTIPILSQATFRTTKTATNTYVTYRVY